MGLCSRPRVVVCETVCAISSVLHPLILQAAWSQDPLIQLAAIPFAEVRLLRRPPAGLSVVRDGEGVGCAAPDPLPEALSGPRCRPPEMPETPEGPTAAGAERFWAAAATAGRALCSVAARDVPPEAGSDVDPPAAAPPAHVLVPDPRREVVLCREAAPAVHVEERQREPAGRLLRPVLPGWDRSRSKGNVSSHRGKCDDKRCR